MIYDSLLTLHCANIYLQATLANQNPQKDFLICHMENENKGCLTSFLISKKLVIHNTEPNINTWIKRLIQLYHAAVLLSSYTWNIGIYILD